MYNPPCWTWLCDVQRSMQTVWYYVLLSGIVFFYTRPECRIFGLGGAEEQVHASASISAFPATRMPSRTYVCSLRLLTIILPGLELNKVVFLEKDDWKDVWTLAHLKGYLWLQINESKSKFIAVEFYFSAPKHSLERTSVWENASDNSTHNCYIITFYETVNEPVPCNDPSIFFSKTGTPRPVPKLTLPPPFWSQKLWSEKKNIFFLTISNIALFCNRYHALSEMAVMSI